MILTVFPVITMKSSMIFLWVNHKSWKQVNRIYIIIIMQINIYFKPPSELSIYFFLDVISLPLCHQRIIILSSSLNKDRYSHRSWSWLLRLCWETVFHGFLMVLYVLGRVILIALFFWIVFSRMYCDSPWKVEIVSPSGANGRHVYCPLEKFGIP